MKRLYSSHNTVVLDQVSEALDQAGIACITRNMNMTGQAAGELPPIVCWPEIWVVDDAEFEPASRVLAAILESYENPGEPWVCKACGEHLEGQFGSCWRCAAASLPPE
ncbi:MAG: DUF2007 domain-containing protein [Gammaproteobacteria bacterium]|nr:DUF2007 domain-containing protein [Gammaproteobacteria bacterium]